MGIDYAGVPCVKITRGSINPATEPDGNRSSFLYNSKFAADVKIAAYDSTPYAPNVTTYWPAGTGESNYLKKKEPNAAGVGTYNVIKIRNAYFSGLPYSLPMFDIKYRRLSTDRFIEGQRNESSGGADPGGARPYYRTMAGYFNTGWWANNGETFGGVSPLGNGLRYYTSTYGQNDADQFEASVIIWRLPGNHEAIIDSVTPSIAPGLRTVEITNSFCRVAKPGYDTRTATPTQLAFDSSGRPLSVIAAGDQVLNSGLNIIEMGQPVDNSNRCDIIQYGGDVVYPAPNFYDNTNCEYWFSGTALIINNLTVPTRVRYLVFSANASAPTFGTNRVFRQFSSGGGDVFQFLRPGSGNSPTTSDIVLDSRWPAVQILAEGYQTVPSGTNFDPNVSYNIGDTFNVSFDPTGMFVFPKWMTVHNDSSYGAVVKPPTARQIQNRNGFTRYNAAGTSYCVLRSNFAQFFTYEGNPYQERYQTGSGWLYDYTPSPMVGIRYYILGIPNGT